MTNVIQGQLCPGVTNYIALINTKGGVLGHKIEYTEFENGFTLERAVGAYERLKSARALWPSLTTGCRPCTR